MEVHATTKYARVAPRKAVALARCLRNLPVGEALRLVEFQKQKAALLIGKTLKSAVANAENNANLSAETLRVKEAVIEAGPTMRRYWARARGMVSPIQRKTSHIRITLTDEAPGR
ncbi:MAG: 50S ribosomal protein L22 [Kiritimatiellae bacterium]|nr:50S ribosomal protein L22 [Kiritimatiellia bacterium]